MMSKVSATPNQPIFLGSKSLSSWPAAALLSGGVGSAILHQPMFFDDRDETRIAQRQQRPVFQLRQKRREPNAADAEGRQERRPMHSETVRMKTRHDKPIELDLMHHGDAR